MRKLIPLILVLSLAFAGANVATAAKSKKSTTGTVWAGVTHQKGDNLIVAGDFEDSLLGEGAIVYVTTVGTDETGAVLIEAKKVTIYTSKGSMRGTGQATQTFFPDGSTTVTDGSFKLTKGTGKYEGHKFKGTFDGTYADGVYTFDYDGVFK